MQLDISTINSQFNNLLKLPGSSNPEGIQRDIARETVAQVQSKYGLNESESKGLVAYASQGYLENKGLGESELDRALAKQLDIIGASQADKDSFTLFLAKYAPVIAPSAQLGGGLVVASRAAAFARVVLAGGTLATGFAAMGPIGIIGAAVAALGFILPSALNTANDYTAMQPTMMAGLLQKLREEQNKLSGIGITNYGSFTAADIDGLYQAFSKSGIQGYNDPLALQSRILTKENLLDTVKGIIGQLNTQGVSPTKADVLAVLSSWMLNEVSSLPNREIAVPKTTTQTTSYTQTPKTRVSESKTAKPKLFTGIIYNGQVGKYEQFVRSVDDEITDDADLKTDVEVNLLKYISKIPNNLSYSIQIKNSPSDELGIPRSGTWCTLSIYLTNQFHKRVFIDEILLGPVDPFVYYPESQKVEQLQYEIPKLVKFDTLHPIDTYRGQEHIVDTVGNVITDVLKDGTRQVAGVSVVAAPAQMVNTTGSAIKPQIKIDSSFFLPTTTNFQDLYRGVGNEIWVIPTVRTMLTEDEIRKAGDLGAALPLAQKRLLEYGIDIEKWPRVPGIADIVTKAQREQTFHGDKSFAEFFGVSAPTAGFPKQVHVLAAKLNVRSQPTSQSATAGSMQLVKGDVFTAVTLVEGETVSGNNKWWKSSLGNFVWSGGTD